jgi:dTDP-L-rhamnose 4-epimerase
VSHKRVLITGGAGFIGSHLADELLARGYKVRALDLLTSQVHGEDTARPTYLDTEVELIASDVRDPQAVRRALKDVDAVFHFAAAVGVGQSMYCIADYVSTNDLGTAVLLEALIENPVEALIVASSMSIYGEGLYASSNGTLYDSATRSLAQVQRGEWELRSEEGEELAPVPTHERKVPSLASIYALTKYMQEQSCLLVGKAYGIRTTALRFFNVYGPRQALSNPYTGVLAIFAARILNGNPPLIYEDGKQKRDFVSVHDVARACRLALESSAAAQQVINVGSGRAYTISEIARLVAAAMGKSDFPFLCTGKYRVGDVRHCFADISLAKSLLGYEPQVELPDGLEELAASLDGQQAADRVLEAGAELAARGLTM